MSSWWYVAIAYTTVWGALAAYAIVLARRTAQSRAATRAIRNAIKNEPPGTDSRCDVPPAR